MTTRYQDKLIEIGEETITFHHYYPFLGDKRIRLEQIDHVEKKAPSLLNGGWRLWGTGDFQTWFPLDYSRAKRDRIFVVFVRGKRMQIGFTAEDSAAAEKALRDSGVIFQ